MEAKTPEADDGATTRCALTPLGPTGDRSTRPTSIHPTRSDSHSTVASDTRCIPGCIRGIGPYTATVSDRYVTALAVVVGLVLVSRFIIASLPLTQWAAPMTGSEALLFSVGCAGLALHCWAMFFPSQIRALPGGREVISLVDPLGTSSILWYAIGAAAIIFGLHSQHLVAQIAAAIGLAAVGYTMYDGGPLNTHLTAIFATVVLLALIASFLVVPPWRRQSATDEAGIPPRSIA